MNGIGSIPVGANDQVEGKGDYNMGGIRILMLIQHVKNTSKYQPLTIRCWITNINNPQAIFVHDDSFHHSVNRLFLHQNGSIKPNNNEHFLYDT